MCVSEPKHYLETLKIGEKRDARTGGGDAFRAVSFFSILVCAPTSEAFSMMYTHIRGVSERASASFVNNVHLYTDLY